MLRRLGDEGTVVPDAAGVGLDALTADAQRNLMLTLCRYPVIVVLDVAAAEAM